MVRHKLSHLFIYYHLFVHSVLISSKVNKFKWKTDWSGYSSWHVFAKKVLLKETSLNLCIIIEIGWKGKNDSLRSSEIVERRLRLERKERLSEIVWDCWKTPAQFRSEKVSSFIQRAETFDGYWNKDMRCRQTGVLRNFSFRGRLHRTAFDLSTDDDIRWYQRVYYHGVPGKVALTLPQY